MRGRDRETEEGILGSEQKHIAVFEVTSFAFPPTFYLVPLFGM